MNFLQETLDVMDRNFKTIDDIDFMNIPEDYHKDKSWYDSKYTTIFDFNKFKEYANKIGDYDNGYGGAEVPEETEIVFKDGTWLSRSEYDGSEWWEYNRTPTILI